MPTVLRVNGFEIQIYTHDHLPKHVHVKKAGTEVVINLNPVTVRNIRGMSTGDMRDAQAIVAANQTFLEAEWDRIRPIP